MLFLSVHYLERIENWYNFLMRKLFDYLDSLCNISFAFKLQLNMFKQQDLLLCCGF